MLDSAAPENALEATSRRPTVVSITPNALRSDSRTLKQAVSLARAGYTSIVLERIPSSVDYGPMGIKVVALAQEEAANRGSTGTTNPLSRLASGGRRYIREDFWRPFRRLPVADLYVLHSYQYWLAVRAKCLLHGRRYIYDAHDFYRRMHRPGEIDGFSRRWRLPFHAWLDRSALRRAAQAFTASEGCAALYEESDGIRPVVLRNVHDGRFDWSVGVSMRKRLELRDDDFLIAAVGHWKPGMGTEALRTALLDLPASIHVCFVGNGYERIAAEIAGRPIAARLHFLPAVPAEQVVPFIRDADAAAVLYYAYTEDYEIALPNRFFQAIGAELPLLYPPLKEIRKLAIDFGLGIEIDPQSAVSIASAIRRLHDDLPLRRELRERARRARTLLSWEREERIFLDLVASVIKKNSYGPR